YQYKTHIFFMYLAMNNNKFKNKYRTSPARLANWDYGSNGLYFITICTKNRIRYFGDITINDDVETQNIASLHRTQNIASLHRTQNIASLRPTEIGNIAIENWKQIPKHFPFIGLDEFVIMP